MILSCQSICKSFGEKVILQDASFHIEEREKAALIGNNGAGKTTLLRIIMEEISADSGQVVIAKDKKIGYLAQYQDIHGHHTIYEELMTTKQYILDMEDKIRSLEQEMKYVAGDKLESLPTIWIWRALHGLRPIFSTTRALYLSFLMTVIFWTR